MNYFFENLHWRLPMQSTPGNRWTTWARSLSAGRRRVYSRHRVAVMQLLRPAIPIYRSSHRWELKAWSLFPRINLVVRPILQQLDAKRSSWLPGRSGRRSSSTSEARKDFLKVGRTAADGSLKSRNVIAGEAHELRASRGKAPATRSVAGQHPVLRYSTFPMQAPLNRVFRRFIAAEIQSEHLRLVTKESVKVARRVVEETRRVERSVPTSMATKQDQVARKILESARGETTLPGQLTEFGKTAPNIIHGSGAPVPGFTIEQLTEQVMRRIDDQIVAHKERMGKVF
jgi:hypothetical protein